MDPNLQAVIDKRIDQTIKALRANRFDARRMENPGQLLQLLSDIMPKESSCSSGGSATLFETGVIDFLRRGDFAFYDRTAPGADMAAMETKGKTCDFYFMSSNAITEQGELFNVDGNGNRISSLIHGPKKIVVIAGYNKIVPNLKAARKRVMDIAAPANARRLKMDDYAEIWSHELVSTKQGKGRENRIVVLLLPQSYGY